jgi:hypothetical protein
MYFIADECMSKRFPWAKGEGQTLFLTGQAGTEAHL